MTESEPQEPTPSEGESIGEPVGEPASDAPAAGGTATTGLLYGIDDIPPPAETVALGFQHYLTMFGSTVAIPLILAPALGIQKDSADLALLMATMFFVSGITTILQVQWGNRLPIVQGGTFSFLAPTFAICGMAAVANEGWMVKIQHVQGAIIMGAIVEIVLGFSGLAGKILRWVGPITIAPTIALIGLALFEFGAPKAGLDWSTGGLTIVLIILFSQILRKKHRAFELYPILLAILLAWGVAALGTAVGWFGKGDPSHVSLNAVQQAPWFRIPYPFQWGMPQFGAAAFIGMLAGYLASMVESIGDYFACARLAGAPQPDARVVNRGIGFEGIGCLIAGVIGTGNGTTSYSENIGAIGLTRVGSRRVVLAGAAIMLVLGTIGKFGALFTTIPEPIVGGMYCALFGMIAAVGLSNLQLVDLNSPRNLFILGFAFFMGLSIPYYFKSQKPLKIARPAPVVLVESDSVVVNDSTKEALALLGITPAATVGQAKHVAEVLGRHYAGSGAMPGANAKQLAALEGAVKAVSTRYPPSPVKWLEDIINTLCTTGMAIAALLALLLDNLVPGTPEERGLAHMKGGHG